MSMPPSPVASMAPLPTPQISRYHPNFTDTSGHNADVTLVARDGTRFRINAAALRLASGVFETTLSLPQPVETEWKEPLIDSLDEDPEVLEDLLRIISGKGIAPDRFISLDSLQPRLLAAEKWDMPAALSIMRILLRTNPDLSSSDPLRVYWLGSHFGWRDVISVASKYTCYDDLFLADKKSLLRKVDATDLLRLIDFHKDRKDQMKARLFDNVATPSNWCSHRVLNADYREFGWRVLEEMDHTPPAGRISGDRLHLFSEEARMGECRCRSCNAELLSRQTIIEKVQSHWADLRETLTI